MLVHGPWQGIASPRDPTMRSAGPPRPIHLTHPPTHPSLYPPIAIICRYRFGPQPFELGGQRALDFILDNQTLSPTNRTLLFDIKLLSVYGKK
jgi:hypothetical protein